MPKADGPITDLGPHPGYLGQFTRNQSDGAIPNATRIVKTNSEPGDSTPNGTPGTVLGSMFAEEHFDKFGYFYFIEWDDKPGLAVGCVSKKVSLEHKGSC